MSYKPVTFSEKKEINYLKISFVILGVGLVAFGIFACSRFISDNFEKNYITEIRNLRNEVIAKEKIADDKQSALIQRIEELTIQSNTANQEGRKSAYLEFEEIVKSKLNPQTAQAEQPKK